MDRKSRALARNLLLSPANGRAEISTFADAELVSEAPLLTQECCWRPRRRPRRVFHIPRNIVHGRIPLVDRRGNRGRNRGQASMVPRISFKAKPAHHPGWNFDDQIWLMPVNNCGACQAFPAFRLQLPPRSRAR
jgi:hypothetical protein